MGYYTKYSLTFDESNTEIIQHLESQGNWSTIYSAWTGNQEPCKWYYHVDDILDLSNKFPTVLLTLYGAGEEEGDLWVKYFLGGKHYRGKAKIIYPEFNPERLA
jgi:flavodoxin